MENAGQLFPIDGYFRVTELGLHGHVEQSDDGPHLVVSISPLKLSTGDSLFNETAKHVVKFEMVSVKSKKGAPWGGP